MVSSSSYLVETVKTSLYPLASAIFKKITINPARQIQNVILHLIVTLLQNRDIHY
jgi:hypothetical protein